MTETRLLYSHSSKINSKAAKSAAHITVICSVNCRRNSATVIYWKTKCTAATDTHTLKHTKIHTQHPLVWWGFPTVCLSESWTNVPYISTPWARCSSLQTHCSCSIQSEICSNGISVRVIDFRFLLIHMGEKKTNTHTHTHVHFPECSCTAESQLSENHCSLSNYDSFLYFLFCFYFRWLFRDTKLFTWERHQSQSNVPLKAEWLMGLLIWEHVLFG